MPDFEDFPRIFHAAENEISVLDRYQTPKDLEDRFITRFKANGVNKFRVFKSYDSYINHINSIKKECRIYHEVSLAHHQQKFKLDIDVKVSEFAGSDYMPIIERFITLIQASFALGWPIEPERADFIVLNSSDSAKISYHIVLDRYRLKNYMNAKQVYDSMMVIAEKSSEFADIKQYLHHIDKNVYNKTQNFRLPGNCKEGTSRFMEIVPNPYNHQLRNAAITQFDPTTLIKVHQHPQVAEKLKASLGVKEIVMEDKLVQAAVEMAKSMTEGCEYSGKKGPCIFYKRMSPGHCILCDREHDNYGSPYLHLISDGTKTHVRFKCLRSKSDTAKYRPSIYLGTIDCSDPQLIIPQIINTRSNIGKIISTAVPVKMPTIADTKIYNSEILAEFKLADTLLVRAAMAMGKTKKLKEYIGEHFTSNAFELPNRKYRILIVSFRRSYTADIKNKFRDFTVYSDVRGSLTADKLIVQVESLHRIPEEANFDLLVLDEVESDFEQFMSGLGSNPRKSWETIERLLRTSVHVVCMDAHLGSRTINMIQRLRPNKDTKMQWNTYKNGADKKYNLTSNLGAFLVKLKVAVDCGDKIVVPTNSHKYALSLQKFIESHFPEVKIGLFDRYMSQEQKNKVFKNVDTEWVNYDIVIYTPTITAGVSFEVPYFHSVYAMFTNKSCGVESCLQMLARVRNLSANTINVYLNCFNDNLPTDISEIEKCLYDRSSYFKDMPELEQLDQLYDESGKYIYANTSYFRLWLENMRVRNISHNNFARHFMGYIKVTGGRISELEELDDKAATDFACEFRAAGKLIDAELYENIASLDATRLNKVTSRCSILKYALFKYYELDLATQVDPKMIKIYSKESVKLMYTELREILCKPKLYDGLDAIIARQNEKRNSLLKQNMSQNYRGDELIRVHIFCVEFISLFGFTTFPRISPNKHYIKFEDEDKVEKNITRYTETIRSCSVILGVRVGKVTCIKDFVKYGSRILKVLYGLKWKTTSDSDTHVYLIEHISERLLFDIGEIPQKQDRPFIRFGGL